MKYFEVEMAMSFTKTIHVKATNEEAAEALAETIFKDTDVLSLTPADLDEFEAFAMPVDDSDDDEDDDEEYGCCDDDLDEDEELPFDPELVRQNQEKLGFMRLMSQAWDATHKPEVHIHITPGG